MHEVEETESLQKWLFIEASGADAGGHVLPGCYSGASVTPPRPDSLTQRSSEHLK